MLDVGSTAKCRTEHAEHHNMQNRTEAKQILVNSEHYQLQQHLSYLFSF